MHLKQSTQVTELIGPFLDKTDGVTEEAGLGGVATEISKAGAAFGAGPVLGTYDSDGWYPVVLTTTHTNTLGMLKLKVHDAATHLPVWKEWEVIAANVFDSLYGAATDKLQVDVAEWLSTAPATPTVAGVPEVDVTHFAGSTTDVSTIPASVAAILVDTGTTLDGRIPAALVGGRMDSSVGAMAANTLTAAATAADFGTEIGVAVWAETTRTLTGTQTFNNTGTWTGNIVGTLSTLTTYTGNTVQTGDTYALANGASGFVATKTLLDAVAGYIDTEIATLVTNVGTILGKFTGITLLAQWLGAMAGKQASDATAQTEMRATGAGSGTYLATTDALEAIRDNMAAGVAAKGPKGVLAKSGSTYSYLLWLENAGVVQTGAGLTACVITIRTSAGDLVLSGSASINTTTGLISGSGTLTTALNDNVPAVAYVTITHSGTDYTAPIPIILLATA